MTRTNRQGRQGGTTPAARLAVLLSSPGLGKSRLIEEVAGRLGDAASVVTAHCDAAGGATFAPVAAALRELFQIEAGASPSAVQATIEAAIPATDAERSRVAGGIAALLAESPASPEETFFVVRRLSSRDVPSTTPVCPAYPPSRAAWAARIRAAVSQVFESAAASTDLDAALACMIEELAAG